jgi:transcription-repair coupling factor (superfamily II helicase)
VDPCRGNGTADAAVSLVSRGKGLARSICPIVPSSTPLSARQRRIRAALMSRNDSLVSQLRAEVAATPAVQRLTPFDERLEVTGASVEARALLLAALQETAGRRIAVIMPGEAATADFETALRLFHRDPQCVSIYPSPSLSPYQDVGPSLGVVREEVRALGRLIDHSTDILIIPARALFQRLPDADSFRSRVIRVAEGEDIDVHALLTRLVDNGFVRTDLVGEAGEFAFRGGILDLFPPTTAKPVRVELFGDTIDSLRWFDVETQRSEEPSGPVTIVPMTQFPVDRATRTALARRLSLDFNDPLYKRDAILRRRSTASARTGRSPASNTICLSPRTP